MRVAVVPVLNPANGGTYQYSWNVLTVLRAWAARHEGSVVLAPERHAMEGVQPEELAGWEVLDLRGRFALSGFLARVRRKLGGPPDPDRPYRDPQVNRILRDAGVDLVLCLYPSEVGFTSGLPFAMAIHDLQHRLNPQFPEVSADGEAGYREYVHRNGIREARRILVQDDVGKQDVLTFYGEFGVRPERVMILPFLPPSYLPAEVGEDEVDRVREAYGLPDAYVFCPAHFWPHKNHLRLVEALSVLHAQRLDVPLVLSGSHGGALRTRTLDEVMRRARERGIADRVRYLGYAPDADMAGLYAGAAALVFPTFFGPASIPILEAWQLGCPVLTSDIRGIREQVGDAGILVDPGSVPAIAEGIRRLWTEPDLRRTIAGAGRARLGRYTWADFESRVVSVLERLRAEFEDGPDGCSGGGPG